MVAAAEVWVSDDSRVIEAAEEHHAQFREWAEGVRDGMKELGITRWAQHNRQSHQRVVGICDPREVVESLEPEWKWLKTKGYARPNRVAAKRWLKELNEPAPGRLDVGIPDLMWLSNMISPGHLVEVLDGRAWCTWSSEGVWDELFDEDDNPKKGYEDVFQNGWHLGRLSEYYAAKEAKEAAT